MRYIASLIFVLLACGFAAAADKVTRVPGTSVSLVPPVGLAPSKDFPGFLDTQTGATLMITEMDGALKSMAAILDAEELKQKGVKELSRESAPLGPHDGLWLEAEHATSEGTALKTIWMFGNDEKTILMTGVVWNTSPEKMIAIEASMRTARWNPAGKRDPLEGLNFRLRDTQGLKLMTRMNNWLIYTEDGQPDKDASGKLIYLLQPLQPPGKIGDHAKFFDEFVGGLNFAIEKKEPRKHIQVDSLDGYTTTFIGTKKEAKSVVSVTMLFDDKTCWVGIGQAGIDRRQEALPIFRKITASFERVK